MTDELITTDHPLSDEARQSLRALLGRIIPASSTYGVPGADDALIFNDFVDTGRNHVDLLAEAVAILDGLAGKLDVGATFAELDDERQQEIANEFYQSSLVPARTVLALVAQCYYRDDRVMQALGMDARPPHPLGYEVEQGDWDLLEPVKQRGKIYKEV